MLDPDKIIKMYQKGLSITNIVGLVGSTSSSISKVLKDAGIPIRPSPASRLFQPSLEDKFSSIDSKYE